MKKIMLMCLCLLFAAPVFAANWVQVDDKTWMDIYSADISGRFVNVWFKDLNPGNWELEKGKKIYYQLSNVTFDCSTRSMSIDAYTIYDLKSQIITANNYTGHQWIKIVPDSIGEAKYNAACSLLRKN